MEEAGMNILTFGPNGSGKGTQGAIIKEKYGIDHIESGAIFREHIKGGTELGKKAKAYIQMRIEIVNAIHSPHSRPHKKLFMATALELTKELRKMACAKKRKPPTPALLDSLINKGLGAVSPRLASHLNLIITP